ncbi:DUF3124 domain-containing protein [Pelagimonas varians]|nr:DUF3124 domain-containing protein [Pelagimonas varians]
MTDHDCSSSKRFHLPFRKTGLLAPTLLTGVLAVFTGPPAWAEDVSAPCLRAISETVYVPALSRIHTQERDKQPLASTLVIHNVDPIHSIELTAVSFHDETGKHVKAFLAAPLELGPFASADFLTEIRDDRGGIGANYLLEWTSKNASCSPEVMAIMIGGNGTHGISFSLSGRVISRDGEETK